MFLLLYISYFYNIVNSYFQYATIPFNAGCILYPIEHLLRRHPLLDIHLEDLGEHELYLLAAVLRHFEEGFVRFVFESGQEAIVVKTEEDHAQCPDVCGLGIVFGAVQVREGGVQIFHVFVGECSYFISRLAV